MTKEEQGLLDLKKDVNVRLKKIVDAQAFTKEEKDSILEFFGFMMRLKKNELAAIHKDARYAEASKEFAKDKTQSANLINVCNTILSEAKDADSEDE